MFRGCQKSRIYVAQFPNNIKTNASLVYFFKLKVFLQNKIREPDPPGKMADDVPWLEDLVTSFHEYPLYLQHTGSINLRSSAPLARLVPISQLFLQDCVREGKNISSVFLG